MPVSMRIGSGFDVHAMCHGRPLILGGVTIPWHQGLAGHSDADVLIHAVCDACLGALGQGDIGRHFPPGDPEFYNIDSRILLREVISRVDGAGYVVTNLDCTVMAERPHLSKHIPKMEENIASDMNVELDRINIKATTTEKLGFIGREEGIAAQAVVLLAQDS